ncbi:hypothetical protein C8Q79DRAFT_126797 [Trametes meyenii]|nr:hypothetical protein C8Q79DRAFT_126797 [Trametes meyenii]
MDWNRVAQAGQRGEASPVMQSYSMIAQELRYHPGQAVNVSSFLPPYSHFYIPGYYVPGLPNAAFVSPSLAPSLLHPFPTLAAPLGAGQPSAIATTVVSAATPPAPTTTIAAPQANPVPAVNLQEYSQHHQIPYRRFPVDAIIRVYDKNMAIWRLCTLMRCRVPGCDYVGPGESLSDHFKSHYKVANTQDGFTCAWLGCSQKVKKMGELKRHLETKHLTIFNWHCSTCHATVRVDDKRGVHPAPGQCAYRGGALDREAVANGSKKTCRECRESPPKSTKELTVKVAFIRNKAQVVGERGVHSKNCSSYFHPEGACGA